MRPDLSALDVQLDALSASPLAHADVLALGERYAGKLGTLTSIDEALNALAPQLPEQSVTRAEASERIELPEPLLQDALLVEDHTGEYGVEEASVRALEFEDEGDPPVTARRDVEPLPGKRNVKTRESGAFTMPAKPVRREDSRDITMEPMDDELLDAELAQLRPEAAPLANNALFDLAAPKNTAAEQEADAAFAELFAEATRQSSMPSISESEPADDTEVFHTDELALDPDALQESVTYPAANAEPEVELEPGFHDETLDSAEFEIVNDVVTDGRPANSASGRPSRPPEKRPSFLGRLFGRKDE